jgi:hypothetical protein
MSITGLITSYLSVRLVVGSGFINIYPSIAPKCDMLRKIEYVEGVHSFSYSLALS